MEFYYFLLQFFNVVAFLQGKKCQVLGTLVWKDYNTKQPLGTIVRTVIIEDNTPYRQKEGNCRSNQYKKLDFKIPKNIEAVNIPNGAIVNPVNPVGTIYGDGANRLSIKCDDLQVVVDNKKEGG